MAIKFVADSSCDIPAELAEKLGLALVSMHVRFGDKSYLDGVDIDSKKFYRLLEGAQELPVTSQPNPQEFEDVYRAALGEGDELIVFTIAVKLSGAYQSACIARDAVCPERIHVIDSATTSIALYILLNEADRLRAQGMSAGAIVQAIEELKPRVVIFAALDSLKYLQKGGRISSAKAFIGSMLNLKPIVRIYKGVVENTEIARGQKRAIAGIFQTLAAAGRDESYPVVFISAAGSKTHEIMQASIKGLADLGRYVTGEFGAIVGSYAGPNSVGIAWVVKEREYTCC